MSISSKKNYSKVTGAITLLKKLRRIPLNQVLMMLVVLFGLLALNFWDKTTALEQELAVTKRAVKKYENAITSSSNSASIPPVQDGKGTLTPLSQKDHILGNKDADLILIEYTDLECPFCKTFHVTMEKLRQEYGSKIGWVFRHFPLTIHLNAQKEGEAAECVGQLGGNEAFWRYTGLIFERTASGGTGFELNKLAPLAAEVGVNEASFNSCMTAATFQTRVKDDLISGMAVGVNGTPGTIALKKDGTFKLISGSLQYEDLKRVVDSLLN